MKLKRIEWVILAALLLLCGGLAVWFYLPRGGETVAVISVDSVERYRIDLAKAGDFAFSIAGETGKPLSFEVKDGAVRFINVTCPDHVCEKAGWCDAPGERAVCLPNRTALVCYAREELPTDSGGEWLTAREHPAALAGATP